MRARFYHPAEITVGQCIELSHENKHHAMRTLRLRKGDSVTLFNGLGGEFSAHIQVIDNSDVKVLVEGHADERGTPEYNIALGERRAKSVVTYLENMGVSADQISVVSYGEEKPMLKDRSEEAFAKNRRAVLVY